MLLRHVEENLIPVTKSVLINVFMTGPEIQPKWVVPSKLVQPGLTQFNDEGKKKMMNDKKTT